MLYFDYPFCSSKIDRDALQPWAPRMFLFWCLHLSLRVKKMRISWILLKPNLHNSIVNIILWNLWIRIEETSHLKNLKQSTLRFLRFSVGPPIYVIYYKSMLSIFMRIIIYVFYLKRNKRHKGIINRNNHSPVTS